jgi:hypothetical protein
MAIPQNLVINAYGIQNTPRVIQQCFSQIWEVSFYNLRAFFEQPKVFFRSNAHFLMGSDFCIAVASGMLDVDLKQVYTVILQEV